MALSPGVLALVLLAAGLHATWNALVKAGGDRTAMLATVLGAPAVLALPFVLILPPPGWAAAPYLALSAAIHSAYVFFLLAAYRYGDLSQVYPIARGLAPVLVALAAWKLAGEALSLPEAAGVAIVSAGIASLAWTRRAALGGPAAGTGGGTGDPRAVLMALATGVMIAGYTLTDGLGVRAAETAYSYIAWQLFTEALVIVPACLWLRRGRIRASFGPQLLRGLFGGCLAAGAYAIAMWAMSLGPLAHVVALRETSVILAALIGTRLMGEPFGGRRLAAASAVAIGAVLLQAGGAL